MQNSASNISMESRRRSRRLASQEPEDFVACSSVDVLKIGNDERVLNKIESNEERKETEGMNIETCQKQVQEDSQNSPVALRTRSRSRCSSMESNDAAINGDVQKAVNIILTPKKKLTTPVKSCRKRTSLMPQLEEIVEEQLKCNNENKSEEKLMEEKVETKEMLKKKRKLSENGRAHVVEIRGYKKSDSAENVTNRTESQLKITEKSWSKSDEDRKESSANVPGKLGNQKKSPVKSLKHFLSDNTEISPSKSAETSPAKILKKSSAVVLEKSPKKSHEEMLTNSSPSADYYLEEAKVITETNLEEDNLNIWPKLDDIRSLWLRRNEHNVLVNNIARAYAFMNEADPEVPTISQELITTDSETIWQQIAYGNKKFHRYFAKKKHLLDFELSTHQEPERKSVDSLPSVTISESKDESFDNAEENSTDLFNLTEDQVKRFDKKVDDNKMCKNDDGSHSNALDSENIDVSRVSDSMSRKRWKSTVDDHFFSLAEMEEYLDKQENTQAHIDENFFEQFDQDSGDFGDFKDSQTDYHYADFYGSTNDNEENDLEVASKKLKKSKKITQPIEENNRMEKKVTFADEIVDDVDNESDDEENHGNGQEATVLFGQVNEEEDNETEFQRRQRKLYERISSIEQANLAPKSWELTGEVTAIERGENTMLEKHVDFDQSAPCAPIITVDTTVQLEAKIIQRIKDKAFDDVLRTERKPESNAAYRAPVAELETVKKSLAEVYEEQYQKTQYKIENEEKVNEKHEEIKKLISSLFQKLNALSHYRYIPSEIRPEVRVLNNMPSLQKEEVGPLASTDAVLLAPEEIHKHVSGSLKGDDEKTKTDRSRSHRKKKKWQHIRELNKQQAELSTKTNEIDAKKSKLVSQYDNKGGNMKLTSTSFFQRLQTKNSEEVRRKKHKIAEVDGPKKKLSTNYKL